MEFGPDGKLSGSGTTFSYDGNWDPSGAETGTLNVNIEHAPALFASIRIAAGALCHSAYSSLASRLVNRQAKMSVLSMWLRGAIDPHGFAAVARTVIGHAGGTPRWRGNLATLSAECRWLRQTQHGQEGQRAEPFELNHELSPHGNLI